MKGCTVFGEVIAVYGGWGTEFRPVYGIPGAERAKGGTVRGATEVCGATEGSTVPGGVIAGWVTGAVYGAAAVVRSTGDTVCGAAAESECGTVGAIHKPRRLRWRSTAAIAAAVTASTICLREGAEAASEPCTVLDRSCTVLDIGAREGAAAEPRTVLDRSCTVLDIGAREGAASEPRTVLDKSCTVLDIGARESRRCVTRGLKLFGGNDGVSLSDSAAWNITGGTCRRSCSVLRGCWPLGAELSLSEPENVARLAFPRPLEGSSRRRWPVGAELSLAEESDRLARAVSNSRRASRSQRSPERVPQAASRRSRRRSVAFTTCSLRGVLAFVARARARLSR